LAALAAPQLQTLAGHGRRLVERLPAPSIRKTAPEPDERQNPDAQQDYRHKDLHQREAGALRHLMTLLNP
jgi:hypothetical protein